MSIMVKCLYRALLLEASSPYLLSEDQDYYDGTQSYQLLDGRTTIQITIRNKSLSMHWSTSLRSVYTIGSNQVEWV